MRQKKCIISIVAWKMAGGAPAVDVLFEVRNAFFLGDYTHCITTAQKIKVGPEHTNVQR